MSSIHVMILNLVDYAMCYSPMVYIVYVIIHYIA